MHGAVHGARRRLQHIVLDGPKGAFGLVLEYALVRLTAAQAEYDAVVFHIHDRGTVYHLCASVRHLCLLAVVVRVEHHDVADAEVCRVGRLRFVKPQLYPADGHLLLVFEVISGDMQPVVDISGSLLFLQRVGPCRGKAGVLLRLVAHFGEQLLVLQKAHEAQVIQTLKLGCRGDGLEQFRELGLYVVLPQPSRQLLLVQHIGSKARQDVEPLLGIQDFAPCKQVAHPYCPVQQLWGIAYAYEPFRISGV